MKQTSSRSSLLLIELIMAILIFALVGGLCLQIFVKSHSLGQRTTELDMAVRQATSVSEILTQKDAVEEELPRLYPTADIDSGAIAIYYDQDFQACDKTDAYFQMNIHYSDIGNHLTAYVVNVCKDNNATMIYRMETTAYRQTHP